MVKRWKALMALGLALVLFVLAGCGLLGSRDNTERETAETAVPVSVAKAILEDMEQVRTFTGKLKAVQEAMVLPKMPGLVETVHVSVGQRVSAGDVVVTLSGSDINIQIKQAQAGFDTAEANVNLSRSRLRDLNNQKQEMGDAITQLDKAVKTGDQYIKELNERLDEVKTGYLNGLVDLEDYEALYASLTEAKNRTQSEREKKLAQRNTLEEGRRGVENTIRSLPFNSATLTAQLNQARVGLELAQSVRENLFLTTPIDGIVAAVTVFEGGFAAQNMPPVTVINTDSLIIDMMVTEAEIGSVVTGETVMVFVEAWSTAPIPAKIVFASPAPDPRTQGYPVRIQFVNPDTDSVKPGMFARVEMVFNQRQRVVTVDKRALLLRDGRRYVYAVRGDTAVRMEVETGLESAERVEILTGLSAGDTIIVQGQEFVQDQGKILVVGGNTP